MRTDLRSLAPWWYNVLFLYTSATVLLAARLSPSIVSELSEESIVEGCQKAIAVLEGYGTFSNSIKRLVTTLRLLYNAVPRQYSRLRQNPSLQDAVKNPANNAQAHHANAWQNRSSVDATDGSLAHSQQSAQHLTYELDMLSQPDVLWDLDLDFDPTDVSWLTTVPFDT